MTNTNTANAGEAKVTFGKMDREWGTADIQIDGEECGAIWREHKYRISALEVVSYAASVEVGDGSHKAFEVSEYGTPRRALAAAKAYVRAEVPRLLAEAAEHGLEEPI